MDREENLRNSIQDLESKILAVNSNLSSLSSQDIKYNDLLLLKNQLDQLLQLTLEELRCLRLTSPHPGVVKRRTNNQRRGLSSSPVPLEQQHKPNRDQDDLEDRLRKLIGRKCRAPFAMDNGKTVYHSAEVLSVDVTESGPESLLILVQFLHPVCIKMMTCDRFLDGNCTLGLDCIYNHGWQVTLMDIKEYIPIDHIQLKTGDACLVRPEFDPNVPSTSSLNTSQLWKEGIVQDILPNQLGFGVKLISNNSYMVAKPGNIVSFESKPPPVNEEDIVNLSSDDEDASYTASHASKARTTIDFVDEDEIVLLEDKSKKKELDECVEIPKIADWESHTKGLGSKLLLKMGYVWGEGLGRKKNGMVEPLAPHVIPQGKSLDWVMKNKTKKIGKKIIYNNNASHPTSQQTSRGHGFQNQNSIKLKHSNNLRNT